MVSKHNNHAKRPKRSQEGFWGRLVYFWGKAFVNIRQNLLLHSLATGTITLALLIIALFLLVYVNVEKTADDWSTKVEVTVYFEREPVPLQLAAIKKSIMDIPGAAKVTYVGKDEAAKRFRARLKGQESLLEGVAADLLPASLEIGLKREYRVDEAIQGFVGRLRKIPGIGEIQYGDDWVKKFNAFMTFLRLVGLLLGGFLLLAVSFIVSNTIKLTIFARRDELEILSLVGATRFFIKAPFLLEGIVQGVTAALLAMLLLGGIYLAFLHNAENFLALSPATGITFLPPEYLAGLLALGIIIGFMGSLVSLKRFITL
jgi:cell division transport system permease protein